MSSSTKKAPTNLQKLPSIDSSLTELVLEARTLFNVLDATSERIRELESCLKDLKANFPFRISIGSDEEATTKQAEPHHLEAFPCVHGYRTKVDWHLAWENEDTSKCFRLCLLAEEKEIVYYSTEDDHVYTEVFATKILQKKPLIETDLSTRMRHSQHLLTFIDAFKDHLLAARRRIEDGIDAIPF
ncbi:MAG: hypothetical protein K2X08_04005 [Chlamydiales bacterium]|nr:hypothetical protein [Chlamydiales bacterium]MBY0529893.1 hypothetical protein [Rhabdochlamydiaceae bacterium]